MHSEVISYKTRVNVFFLGFHKRLRVILEMSSWAAGAFIHLHRDQAMIHKWVKVLSYLPLALGKVLLDLLGHGAVDVFFQSCSTWNPVTAWWKGIYMKHIFVFCLINKSTEAALMLIAQDLISKPHPACSTSWWHSHHMTTLHLFHVHVH